MRRNLINARSLALAGLLGTTGVAGTAGAQPSAQAAELTATSREPETTVAITISPVHLMFPVAELTAELRVAPRIGVAGIVGIGKVEDFTALEVGGQAAFYVLGSFDHGMQLGVEGLFLHVSDEDDSVSGVGRGFALGPYAGYKIATASGFTFVGQLGVQKILIEAEASSGTASATAKSDDVIPLLNLNVGWSF